MEQNEEKKVFNPFAKLQEAMKRMKEKTFTEGVENAKVKEQEEKMEFNPFTKL